MRLELVRALETAPVDWNVSLHAGPPHTADVVVCGPDIEIVDIEGALRFDPDAPERLVENIAAAARLDGRSVVVTSAGGGTGVTSIALHMAAELASRGFTTALVDMSSDRAVGARVGLDLVGGDSPQDRVVPVPGGFRLLMTDEPDFARVMERAHEGFDRVAFDRVVADAAANMVGAIRPQTPAVVVIQPSPCGIDRARDLIRAHPSAMWLPVVNRLGAGGEMTASMVGRDLGIPVAVELPCCPALRDREDEGRLLKPGWTRWTRRIARIIDLIER